MEGGRIVEERVRVERVKCASCGRTHALMPPEAVPYSPFSLEIHFLALAMHGDADARVRDACERCGISVRTLYRIASHAAELAVALASVGSPSPARDLPAAAARCASLRRTFAVVHCAAFRRAPFQNVRSRNVTRRARQRAPVST